VNSLGPSREQRFTPSVTQVINLILSDVGRPVNHILSNLAGYDRLVEDVQAVLDRLTHRCHNPRGDLYLLSAKTYCSVVRATDAGHAIMICPRLHPQSLFCAACLGKNGAEIAPGHWSSSVQSGYFLVGDAATKGGGVKYAGWMPPRSRLAAGCSPPNSVENLRL